MMTTTHSVLVSISPLSILSPIVLRSVVYGNLKFSWNDTLMVVPESTRPSLDTLSPIIVVVFFHY